MIVTNTITLSYGRELFLELLDARTIKVTTNCAFVQNEYIENSIFRLNYANQYTLALGDIMSFRLGVDWEMDFKFKVNQIKEFDGYYILYSHKRTKSSYFLTPMLGYNKEYFKWNQFYINSYSKCPEYNKEGNYLFLLYKYMPIDKYTEFEKSHIKLNTFVEILYPEIKDEIIFVHKLADKYNKDIVNFSQGKYSSMSDTVKRQILYFHNTNKEGELGQILFKAEQRRKQMEMEFMCKIPVELDLWDCPDDSEILTLKNKECK